MTEHVDIIQAITGRITPSITLQVTEDCCLNCTQCYQINKKPNYMTKETAEAIINFLFEQHENPHVCSPVKKDTPGVILDFIGGEPLMNIEVINHVVEYFFSECAKRGYYDWIQYSRFSMASNGMLYFEPKVQDFIKKYHRFLSLTFSIDGPEYLHDRCRITKNGEGSFKYAKAALDYHKAHYDPMIINSTKVTIAPDNLPYLFECVKFFQSLGTEQLHANPIFEHQWSCEEANKFYQQLKQIADFLLDLETPFDFSLFNAGWYRKMSPRLNDNWCGGTGKMLSFDPQGNIYPCLRYSATSLGNSRKPMIIGNLEEGFFDWNKQQKEYKEFISITRESQSTKECFKCPVASGCSWCSAWNYQEFGTANKRSTRICNMHRAAALATSYYWNKYYMKHNIQKHFPCRLERSIATTIISDEEYDMLIDLSLHRIN